jgi:GcrA cell cycle regulator
LRLGVTPNAVVGKAKRLGLPARPSPIRAPLDAEGRTRRMPKAKREEVFAQVAQSHAARPPRTDTLAHIRRLSAVASLPIPPVRTCQWMEGERFAYVACGQRVKAGKPYCACHAAIAYKPRWVA